MLDRGRLGEAWYVAFLMLDREGAPPAVQVYISRSELAEQHVSLERSRFPDVVDGDTIREVKFVSGPLGGRDLEQFEDFMRVARAEALIMVRGTPVQIRFVRYVFPEPRGVCANWLPFIEAKVPLEPELTVEILNAAGQAVGVNETTIGSDEVTEALRWNYEESDLEPPR